MAEKIKALIVGGEDRNIPSEVRELLDFKHVEQSAKTFNDTFCPDAKCIILIAKFSREAIASLAKKIARKRGIPFVSAKTGNYIIHELINHKIIDKHPEPKVEASEKCIVEQGGGATEGPMDAVGDGAVASSPSTSVQPETVGLSPEELWDQYGQKAIDTLKSALKPGEKVTEDDLLAIFSIDGGVGLPPKDALELLPELSIRGIIANSKGRTWKLVDHNTIVDGVEIPEEEDHHEEVKSVLADVPTPPVVEKKKRDREDLPQRKIVSTNRHSTVYTTSLFGGLPDRAYPTMASLWREALRYKEFSFPNGKPYAVTYYWNIIPKAIKAGKVFLDKDGYRVIHDASVKLTLIDNAPPSEDPKERKLVEHAPVFKNVTKKPQTPKDIVKAINESFEGGSIPTIDRYTMATRFLKKLMPERYWNALACQYIARIVNIGHHDNALALKDEFSKMEWDRLAYGVIAKLPVEILVPFMKDEPKDEELTCVECMDKFLFTVQEWKFYQDKFGDEATFPKRCPKCRKQKG